MHQELGRRRSHLNQAFALVRLAPDLADLAEQLLDGGFGLREVIPASCECW